MNGEQHYDRLYDSVLKGLPFREKLRLLERLAHDLALEEPATRKPTNILDLEGIWAGLLNGQDAQEYITQSRDEWDAPVEECTL